MKCLPQEYCKNVETFFLLQYAININTTKKFQISTAVRRFVQNISPTSSPYSHAKKGNKENTKIYMHAYMYMHTKNKFQNY